MSGVRPLFRNESFVSHSGLQLTWKIDCDALTDADIETLARIVADHFRFGKVIGVPSGGLRLAEALQKYRSRWPHSASNRILIVDDVLTTGGSMAAIRDECMWSQTFGVVIFARGECPEWITPIFNLHWEFVK